MVSNSGAGMSNLSEITFGEPNKSSPGPAVFDLPSAASAAGATSSARANRPIACSEGDWTQLLAVGLNFIVIKVVMWGGGIVGTPKVRPVEYAKHGIPGGSEQRDLN